MWKFSFSDGIRRWTSEVAFYQHIAVVFVAWKRIGVNVLWKFIDFRYVSWLKTGAKNRHAFDSYAHFGITEEISIEISFLIRSISQVKSVVRTVAQCKPKHIAESLFLLMFVVISEIV